MPRRSVPADTAADAVVVPLKRYTEKRDFRRTPEPSGAAARTASAAASGRSFVVQKHWATRLHYDFRLEHDGVLLSWAVPKGPCFDPKEKRMAIHVEDHPVDYGGFEGTIPPRQYGAGKVIVWDRGTWEPVGDAAKGMADGKLVFRLHGEKLAGLWELVRIAKPGDRQDPWLLFKKRDEWARPLQEYDVIVALPDSVVEHPLGLAEERVADASEASAAAHAPAVGSLLDASALPGAQRAPLPDLVEPQLASLSEAVPVKGRWLCEVKFDGYRLLARIDGRGGVRLYTRKGNDWTSKLESLADEIGRLGLKSTWLDGEIVVLREDGMPDFNALQNAFDRARTKNIDYFLFDLPFADGHDLRRVPLSARRSLLKGMVDGHGSDRIRFSADFDGDPEQVLKSACRMGLEGIIVKRLDAPYESARTRTWLKVKCHARQEFVVAGFIDRTGSTREVGSLVLAYHGAGGKLEYAGNVGSGWDSETAIELRRRLAKLRADRSPFDGVDVTAPGRWSRRSPGGEQWVRPELIVEVSFAGWTPEGRVRHAVYQGLRDDKPAVEVVREKAVAPAPADVAAAAARRSAAGSKVGSVKVSHPERVIDVSTGLTKLDLVRYYESIAEHMLPHLRARPVSLVRGPNGIGGQLFFQKHDDALSIPGLRKLDPSMWPDHQSLLEVANAQGLVSAAQMNVIEFHTWNSTTKRIAEPDRMVFDLDPGEGVRWPQVQEAAVLMRTLLDELKLACWLKTSGGKGLHVVVPIAPKLDYDTVKDLSQKIVQHLARTIPQRFVAKSGASNRVGKVFVDYLRNGFGATTAAAFSARARPGLGVSMPVSWEQLSELKSGANWTIATAREYLSFQREDPWATYWKSRQTVTAAMKALGPAVKR